MVSKAFKKCIELIEEMLREGYKLQITSLEVEKLIKISIGADKRTVQKYTRILTEDLAFLKTVTKNQFGIVIYKINIEAIEQFINEHLKEKLKQLRLSDIRLKQEIIEKEVKTE